MEACYNKNDGFHNGDTGGGAASMLFAANRLRAGSNEAPDGISDAATVRLAELSKAVAEDDPLLAQTLRILIDERWFSQPVSSEALKNLGDRLELRPEDRVEFNGQVFRLTDVIQQATQVARFYVSGSYGRRVTIGTPEVDLVIFLRDSHLSPPYDKHEDDLLPLLHRVLVKEFTGSPDVRILPLRPNPQCFLGNRNKAPLCAVRDDSANRRGKMRETIRPFDSSTGPGGTASSTSAALSNQQKQQPPQMNPCNDYEVDDHRDVAHRCCNLFISVIVGKVRFRLFLAPALARTSESQRQIAYRHMQHVYLQGGLLAVEPWFPCLVERPSEQLAHAPPIVKSFIRLCQLFVRVHRIASFDSYAVEVLAFLIIAKHINSEVTNSASVIPENSDDEYHGAGCGSRFKLKHRTSRNNSSCSSSSSTNVSSFVRSDARRISSARLGPAAASHDENVPPHPSSSPLQTRGLEHRATAVTETNLVLCFHTFLDFCENLHNARQLIRITLPATFVSPWLTSETASSMGESLGSLNHLCDVDDPHTSRTKLLLFDNYNPYCNLLSSLTRNDQARLKLVAKHAKNNLERSCPKEFDLDDLQQTQVARHSTSIPFNLSSVFSSVDQLIISKYSRPKNFQGVIRRLLQISKVLISFCLRFIFWSVVAIFVIVFVLFLLAMYTDYL